MASVSDYDEQKWYEVYKTALLELERASMTGRIGDARTEIASRLEVLAQHPQLHQDEYRAIQDALNNLRTLEKEETRMKAEDRQRLLDEAKRRLQVLAPKFQGHDPQKNSDEG